MTTKLLRRDVQWAPQGWRVVTLLSHRRAPTGGQPQVTYKLRVVFDIDTSYKSQSSASVEVWSARESEWHSVHAIPGSALNDDGYSFFLSARPAAFPGPDAVELAAAYVDNAFERACEEDYDLLLEFAKEVLS